MFFTPSSKMFCRSWSFSGSPTQRRSSPSPSSSMFSVSLMPGGPTHRGDSMHRGGSAFCHGAIRKSLFLATMLALVATVAPQLRAGGNNHDAAFAQKLVDETGAKHKPQLIYLGLHGVTPHSKGSVIFASTKSEKIGKKSSCADLHVVEKGIPVLEMKGKTTTVLERLLDKSGHTVGLIVVGFDLPEGQESEAAKLGKEVGQELAQQISSKDQLFGK